MARTDRTLPSPEQLLSLLKAAPLRIVDLTAGFSSWRLCQSPTAGAWSANEILAHLRACSDVWGDGIAVIIAEDRPTLRAINPRTWMPKTGYLDQEFTASLEQFRVQRAGLVATLEALPAPAWSRAAMVRGAGPLLEWTVLSYVERLAIHERSHVNSLARILRAPLAHEPLQEWRG